MSLQGVSIDITNFSKIDTQLALDVIPCKIVRMTVGIAKIQIGIRITNQDTSVYLSSLHTKLKQLTCEKPERS